MKLSDTALRLLKEAAQDPQGVILKIYLRGGLSLQTNGKRFAGNNPVEEAELREALSVLESEGLIEPSGKESFKVTAEGHRLAKGEVGESYDAVTIEKIISLIEETRQEMKKPSTNEVLDSLKSKIEALR
jgi:predicted transcriptional regulator